MMKRIIFGLLMLCSSVSFAFAQGVTDDELLDFDSTPPMAFQTTSGVFRGFLEAGIGYSERSFAANLFGTYGYKFDGLVYLGAGAGVHYVHNDNLLSVPLYINPRIYFSQIWSDPFLDLKIGYSLNATSFNEKIGVEGLQTKYSLQGLYVNPAFGYETAMAGRFFTFTASFPMQFGRTTTSASNYTNWTPKMFWGAMFSVGIRL